MFWGWGVLSWGLGTKFFCFVDSLHLKHCLSLWRGTTTTTADCRLDTLAFTNSFKEYTKCCVTSDITTSRTGIPWVTAFFRPLFERLKRNILCSCLSFRETVLRFEACYSCTCNYRWKERHRLKSVEYPRSSLSTLEVQNLCLTAIFAVVI